MQESNLRKETMPRRTKNSAQRLQAKERDREALKMRIQGMKLADIGEALGVQAPAVSKMLSRSLALTMEDIRERAEELRAIQLERIESMIFALWDRVENGDDKAIDSARQLLARQAKLLGIDAPQRAEWSGPDGGPIEFSETRESIMGKLARLAADIEEG